MPHIPVSVEPSPLVPVSELAGVVLVSDESCEESFSEYGIDVKGFVRLTIELVSEGPPKTTLKPVEEGELSDPLPVLVPMFPEFPSSLLPPPVEVPTTPGVDVLVLSVDEDVPVGYVSVDQSPPFVLEAVLLGAVPYGVVDDVSEPYGELVVSRL